jgi:hypothetical protein
MRIFNPYLPMHIRVHKSPVPISALSHEDSAEGYKNRQDAIHGINVVKQVRRRVAYGMLRKEVALP